MHVSLGLSTVVFLFCAQNVFSSRVVKHSEDLRQQVLRELNEFREKFAKAAQVSNMNELTYDLELEKVARHYNSCRYESLPDRIERYQFHVLYKKKVENDFIEYTAQHRNDTKELKEFFGNEDMFFWVLQSKIEKVGCFHFSKLCVREIWYRAAIFTDITRSPVRGYCIFGPKERFTSDDIYYGKPGSHCSGERTRGGLCKVTN